MEESREAPRAARLRDITRRFGSVTALDRVRFDLLPGEIHGLLGENGAGKTTLARVLGGLLTPDEGQVEIGGLVVALRTARDARAMGVAMVHQHFSLVPRFTGFDNVALFNGEAWTGRGTAARGYRARVEARAAELKLDVALDVPVAELGVGERQRIEILKALMSETRVLLLDEPTAVLTPREVDGLYAVLRQVARAGTGIVLVAHKLDEVLAAADRVTVLRRGQWVLTGEAVGITARELAEAMVGGSFPGAGRASRGAETGRSVAELADVTVEGDGASSLRGVTLTVHRGEIVGVAGVDGNGQRDLAGVLAGVVRPAEGTATLPDEVGWIPQDRGEEGLVNDFTIAENVALALHGAGSHRKGPWLDWAGIGKTAAALVREMDVRGGSPGEVAGTLSGGKPAKGGDGTGIPPCPGPPRRRVAHAGTGREGDPGRACADRGIGENGGPPARHCADLGRSGRDPGARGPGRRHRAGAVDPGTAREAHRFRHRGADAERGDTGRGGRIMTGPATDAVRRRKGGARAGLRAAASATAALVATMAIAAGLLALGGYAPGEVFAALARGSFGSWDRFVSFTLVRATPLLLTGLAIALAFKAHVLNIGAEGQLHAGALAGVAIALLLPGAHAFLILPVTLLAAATAGALWASVPAAMKTAMGVGEVITTLLMNFVALFLAQFLVQGPLRESRGIFNQTDEIPAAAHLPRSSPARASTSASSSDW